MHCNERLYNVNFSCGINPLRSHVDVNVFSIFSLARISANMSVFKVYVNNMSITFLTKIINT